jgi:single-strand DNA-binding protein
MFQQTIIVGNLGKDPEKRFTPSGQSVCSFSVATEHSYTNANGEKIKQTTWFRVTAWGKLSDICHQYLSKGKKVQVVGRLNSDKSTGGPRVWEKDGKSGSSYELVAASVLFLSPHSPEASSPGEMAEMPSEEEVPF